MTEFHTQLRDRAREALRQLADAQAADDDFSFDFHTGELDTISRLADEHDLRVPELDAWRRARAA